MENYKLVTYTYKLKHKGEDYDCYIVLKETVNKEEVEKQLGVKLRKVGVDEHIFIPAREFKSEVR